MLETDVSVTWVEHVEYDESVTNHLYRPLINAGMGFSAQTSQLQNLNLFLTFDLNLPLLTKLIS